MPAKKRSPAEAPARIKIGTIFETTFYTNPKTESPFRYRATHIDGRRAPKVILSDDARIQPGKICQAFPGEPRAGKEGIRSLPGLGRS